MAENERFFPILAATLLLTGIGYTIIVKWMKYREQPLILGNKTAEEVEREFTVSIPDFWIPWQAGDSEAGVTERFRPNISFEGTNWLVQFQPIQTNLNGIITSYTPPAVKLPVLPNVDTLALAIKFLPTVIPTIDPRGWTIKFPKFTVQS